MYYVEWNSRQGPVCHAIYDREEADAIGLKYLEDWKQGRLDDWVLTDDNKVVQVLKDGADRAGRRWVRTATMTAGTAGHSLDTEPRESRYTFNGKKTGLPKQLTTELMAFCKLVADGHDPVEAYLQTVSAKSKTSGGTGFMTYVRKRVKDLMNHEPVRDKIKEEVDELLEKAGIDNLWIVKRYKLIAMQDENFSAAVSATNMFAELSGLQAKEKDSYQIPALPAGAASRYLPINPRDVAEVPESKPEEEDEKTELYDHAEGE